MCRLPKEFCREKTNRKKLVAVIVCAIVIAQGKIEGTVAAKTVCVDADVFKGLIATAKVVSHETYGQWLVVVFDNSGKIVLNMVASM